MEVRLKVSKSTLILLGAAFGVTLALITPSSVDADNKKKQQKNDPEHKNAATNTSKVEKISGKELYGDSTVNEILEKAKSEIRKIWDQSLKIILMKSQDSSNASSGIYDDAQTSLPQTENQMEEIFNPIPDSSDLDSTMYTPFGKLECSRHSTLTNRAKKSLSDIAKGYRRANTSKNDNICSNFPRQSTLIETENKVAMDGNIANENFETRDDSNSCSRINDDRRLVLSFKPSFSPVVRVFQAVKNFKRVKKRSKGKVEADDENNNNQIQNVEET